jgi:hypothetical protein
MSVCTALVEMDFKGDIHWQIVIKDESQIKAQSEIIDDSNY